MKRFRVGHIFLSLAFGLALLFVPASIEAQDHAAAATGDNTKPPPASKPDPCQVVDLIPPATVEVPVEPVKHIIISIADQQMWVFEDDNIVQRFPVSTGRPGHPTPTGHYSVHNRSPRAFSRRYECYMLQWMAITSDGMIGMHALEGHSYERHLGSVASHGCIRLSHVNAEWLYTWVQIGTPVEIVADYNEPVPEVNMEKVLTEYPFHW